MTKPVNCGPVMQTERGIGQAKQAAERIQEYMAGEGEDYKLYFYMSPYKRSQQTFEALASSFRRDQIQGCQEEVQLREQDFGNFQVSCMAVLSRQIAGCAGGGEPLQWHPGRSTSQVQLVPLCRMLRGNSGRRQSACGSAGSSTASQMGSPARTSTTA